VTERFDVQFTDVKKEYAFGVAVSDNAQVRRVLSGSAQAKVRLILVILK
jgi:hypothetical protein